MNDELMTRREWLKMFGVFIAGIVFVEAAVFYITQIFFTPPRSFPYLEWILR